MEQWSANRYRWITFFRSSVCVDGVSLSDLERGFIRADVVACTDLIQHVSLSACRAKGILRLEGKDYIVREGDVMEIRFNV
ncbi:MAG: DUF933 domain-containing protein [Candidatus Marinimicrobia bacterium]|nr:DUF933 domain-containing protein [Candidatus Neomarinimicrobiota bacterium]